MSQIRADRAVSTAGDRETIRCFVQVLNDTDSQDVAHETRQALNGWSFDTFAQHFVLDVQSAESPSAAVDHARQALKLYPESMHVIVGPNVLDGTQLHAPLKQARSEFKRGHLAVVQLGSPKSEPNAAIDGVIRIDNPKPETRRVIRKLHYQRPVPKRESPCAPVIHVIKDQQEFMDALKVRFAVYDLMGYIPEHYRSAKTGLELDYLDKYSLHYTCMLPGEIDLPGATLRLITRRQREKSSEWVAQTLRDNPDQALRRSARAAQFQEMPVFNSIHRLDGLQKLLQTEDTEYCELSRVVVNEKCRGMGLSRGLIEFALQDAKLRGIRCVFLACVPEQVEMYEKYGFTHFPSDTVTFARVQQPAQAMFQFLHS